MQPVRRVVTGHDPDGRSVVISDSVLTGRSNPKGDVGFTLLWTAPCLPVDNDDPTAGRDGTVSLTASGGSSLRVVELAPRARTPMHRTTTLDYGFVLSGEVDLILDDGVTTRIKAGEVVVKRGSMHAWSNPSDDGPARIAFVILDAIAATVGGRSLLEILPGAPAPS